jgi:hypothetical protein
LSINNTGNFTYDVNEKYNESLNDGDTASDIFTYIVNGDSTKAADLTINIKGTDDAPIINAASGGQCSLPTNPDPMTEVKTLLLSESFENGKTTSDGWYVEYGNNGVFTGDHGVKWTLNSGGVEIQSGDTAGSTASDGDKHAELDPHGCENAKMTTTVNLGNNDSFELSFDYKPRPGYEDSSDMKVSFGGIDLRINSDSHGNLTFIAENGVTYTSTLNSNGWYTIDAKFSGLTGSTAQLVFEGQGQVDTLGAFIDDIKLVGIDNLSSAVVDQITTIFKSSFEVNLNTDDVTFVNSVDGWTKINCDYIEIRDELIENGNATFIGKALDGTKYVELNTDDSNTYPDSSGITRTVDTVKGASYELDFNYSARPGYNGEVCKFVVVVDGVVLGTYSEDGTGLSTVNWINNSVTFTGTGNPVEIQFREAGTSNPSAGRGMFIDDISLVQTIKAENTPINLIVNGSFENVTGIDGNGNQLFDPQLTKGSYVGMKTLTGWELMSSESRWMEVHESNHAGVGATDGENYLDLGESATISGNKASNYNANTYVGQVVNGVVDGNSYEFSFDYKDKAAMQEAGTAGQNSGVVEVYWGGKLISTIQGNNTTNWETFKVTVIGGSGDGSNRIEFKEVGEGFDNWGIAIDNVSLVGIDTPNIPTDCHIVSDINISDVDDSNLESAKVVLINYKAGDVIEVNKLPAVITASTNVVNGQLVVTLTGTATVGKYEEVIESLTYTSTNPSEIKNIEITVNDGTKDSNTINISFGEDAPLNTAPDAVDDLSHNISGIVLVSENFENGTAQGWTNNTVTTVGEQKTGELTDFLGRFGGTCGSESISKTFDFGIENAGNTVTIEFDMYEIDSWDGEHFKVFTNGKEVSSNAMYWDDCNGNKDGGKATSNNEFTGYGAEEIHHYSLQATVDKNGHVKLGFGSTLDQGIADESWGIDNVTITANNGWKTNSTNEDTAITVDVLANDTDPENDVLSITHIQGQDITNGQTINIVNAGIVVGTAQVVNGQIVFTPGDELQKLNNGDNQSVVFDYSIIDGNGGSDSANVSINVTGVTDIVVTPINATLCGTKDIAEGNSGWYNVQLDKAVTQDTWVTVQVYDGTAYRVDANGCEQQNQDIIWGGYFDTRDSYGRVVDIYYDQVPNSATSIAYGTRTQVGPDYATWDFTVEKDGFVQNGGVITLLIKAGATTSNYFEVQTWKEKITVDNDLYSSDAGNEHTETLSMVITTVTGNSSDIINYNNTYKNVNIIDGTCVFRVSPITLDLTNDGQIGVTGETSSIDKDIDNIIGTTVEFDIDGDGKLDTIEWIDGLGDGLLVDNRDGNATNNMDGKRLFGDEGGKYSNGYEKLALLDINNDGQLTDDELTGLNVWIDNGDAKVQDGELKTLAELDITSLSVKMTETTGLDGKMHMESVAVKADGTEIMTEDVWFTSNDIDLTKLIRSEDGSNIIDIINGNTDKLTIDIKDVIDFVDSDKELIIKGDLGDKVDLDTPSDWSNTGATKIEGISYNVYQGLGINSTIKLLIEDDIDVTPDI